MSTPDDPYGDKAWLEARRPKADIVPPAATLREEYTADAERASEEAREKLIVDGLRADVLDVDRIDVESLIKAKAGAARAEHGWTWTPDAQGLPPACPVTPLGKQGGTFWFLTPDAELMGLEAGKFGQAHVDALFAPLSAYVVAMWGAASKSQKTRVQYEVVRRDLMDACARKGVFDPGDKVRGRGAWRSPSGGLVLHYGDRVVIDGQAQPPGAYGDHVYPARPKLTPPLGDGKAEARAAARRLLELFQGWRWRRGELDARLLLGWTVASLMGAALDWRPQVMLTGDAGMGKSTLQHLLKACLGERLLDVADASAAGLYQTLGFDSLGVAFDEFENEEDGRGAAVMRLARLASSGARLVRGGADGVPSNYQARGAFLFSAINPPAMRPAEASRTAVLALLPPAPGQRAPKIPADEAAAIGASLAARVIHAWPFWAERLDWWREALAGMGHSSRAQDQFGTLLAAADLALDDAQPHADELDEVARHLSARELAETAGATPNWRRCVNHALAAAPDAWRTLRYKQLGQALAAFCRQDPDAWSESAMRAHLALAGLALVRCKDSGAWQLGFPGRHPALARLYDGTDWRARPGADGAWINALSQAPEGLWRRDRFRVGGPREGGVLIRLDAALEVDEGLDPTPEPEMEVP